MSKFYAYFKSRYYLPQSSAPLIPDDPSLLFVNAGMVPYKRYFLDPKKAGSNQIVSIQNCIRMNGTPSKPKNRETQRSR